MQGAAIQVHRRPSLAVVAAWIGTHFYASFQFCRSWISTTLEHPAVVISNRHAIFQVHERPRSSPHQNGSQSAAAPKMVPHLLCIALKKSCESVTRYFSPEVLFIVSPKPSHRKDRNKRSRRYKAESMFVHKVVSPLQTRYWLGPVLLL